MLVKIPERQVEFRPWRPANGLVLSEPYAFDCETTRIDESRHWLPPSYVLGAASDGRQGYFVCREHVGEFFAIHRTVPVAMHNAAFDLRVVQLASPDFDIYELVDNSLVSDTQLLHRLYMLGTAGHTASGKGQSTLDHCAERYLGFSLPKDVQDSRGQDIRTSFGQWLSRPPQEIEPVYLEYLGKDVLATLFVFLRQRELLHELLGNSQDVFGYVSPQWLAEQVRRWGWQTHHIQLKASIVLQAVTANGLGIDLDRRNELVEQLDEVLGELRESLSRYGYLPGQPGSDKALQEILRYLEHRHPDRVFPRTATERYATSREALSEIANVEPFVRDLLSFKETEKLKSSFLNKMARRRLHPSFNTMMVSGRTSSFGEINAQNLPRDDRVRSCFVPTAGHIFIDADYSTVELATLAQAIQIQFGLPSKMGDAINAGSDLHRVLAARVTGKPETTISSEERQKAKPVNFGLPGGMGHAGLQRYAKSSYGVELSDEDAESLSDAWFDLFPEMDEFLHEDTDLGQRIAEFFDLTPHDYAKRTRRRQFHSHGHKATQPAAFLGGMFLKTLKVAHPKTRDGASYLPDEVQFFWSQAKSRLGDFPKPVQSAVANRKPSARLQRAAMGLVDRDPVFTLTGRLRANASYCARHNTVFQGLAADGAKLALWLLWRAGYRIVNFVHDEVLIEIPFDSDWTEHAVRIKALMIQGMQEVVPDIRIDVEFAATERWLKGAKPVFNKDGKLCLWNPEAVGANAGSAPLEPAMGEQV